MTPDQRRFNEIGAQMAIDIDKVIKRTHDHFTDAICKQLNNRIEVPHVEYLMVSALHQLFCELCECDQESPKAGNARKAKPIVQNLQDITAGWGNK